MTAVASDLRYEDVAVGSVYSIERTFTQEDVLAFADVSGDFPIALMLRTNPVQMTKVTSIAR